LVDECTGPSVEIWLLDQAYDVFSVNAQAREIRKTAVIVIATRENRIIITNVKVCCARVVHNHWTLCEALMVRMRDAPTANKIRVIK
jgi:predicted nuclease of predicted toxin-antitoxin system